MSETVEELWTSLLATPHTGSIIRTDSCGRVADAIRVADVDGALLAERVDLAMASLLVLGSAVGAGELSIAVLDYHGALLLAGVVPGGHVAVVAAPQANVGLLLSRLRRLIESARARGET